MDIDDLCPDGGVVRLFPLPNLVLFPGAMQPLHIFEPRYRQMTADALAGDRLIATVLPRPGWEESYAGSPDLHQVACLGRILAEQRLPDGRFNILLRGVQRIRITREVPQETLYRAAEIEPLEDVPWNDLAIQVEWRARLRERVPRCFEGQSEVRDRFVELIDGTVPLGALVDLMAFTLPLDAEFKQALLEELDVSRRVDRLLQQLDAPRRPFPPEFSVN
jgi:Lon protease-like protein